MRSRANGSATMIIVTERRRSVLRNGCLWIAAVATMLLVGVLATFTGYPVVSSARADPGPGKLGLAHPIALPSLAHTVTK